MIYAQFGISNKFIGLFADIWIQFSGSAIGGLIKTILILLNK